MFGNAKSNESGFCAVRGSVLEQKVDAIVNAANNSLLGGGGVDGAIHAAAGPELLVECRALHGCETGNAKITGSHQIKNAKYIIHTVGPVYSGRREDALRLASCYQRSLDLAMENKCHSVAFPGISTGVYGYPIYDAAEIAIEAVGQWICEHSDYEMKVIFCCFREEEMKAYEDLL